MSTNQFDPTLVTSLQLSPELSKTAADLLQCYQDAAGEAERIRLEARRRLENVEDAARRSAFHFWTKLAKEVGLNPDETWGTGEWVIDARFFKEHGVCFLCQKRVEETESPSTCQGRFYPNAEKAH